MKAYRNVDIDGTGHLNMDRYEHILFFKECLKLLLAKLAYVTRALAPLAAYIQFRVRESGEGASAVSSSYDVVPYSQGTSYTDSSGLFDNAVSSCSSSAKSDSFDVFEGSSSPATSSSASDSALFSAISTETSESDAEDESSLFGADSSEESSSENVFDVDVTSSEDEAADGS